MIATSARRGLILLAFFAITCPLYAANLLGNGGFESPVVPSSSQCGPYFNCIGYLNGVGDHVGPWLVIGTAGIDIFGNPIPNSPASLLLTNANYVEPNGATGATLFFHPEEGLQALDLTGEGNQGTGNGVKQTVATFAGQEYFLTWWVGHQYNQAPGYLNGPAEIALYIDGVHIIDVGTGNNTVNDVTWQEFSYSFTAGGNATTIAFLNDTPVGNNYAGLDNVTLQAVPEPGTLALLAIGLSGALARRKRAA